MVVIKRGRVLAFEKGIRFGILLNLMMLHEIMEIYGRSFIFSLEFG